MRPSVVSELVDRPFRPDDGAVFVLWLSPRELGTAWALSFALQYTEVIDVELDSISALRETLRLCHERGHEWSGLAFDPGGDMWARVPDDPYPENNLFVLRLALSGIPRGLPLPSGEVVEVQVPPPRYQPFFDPAGRLAEKLGFSDEWAAAMRKYEQDSAESLEQIEQLPREDQEAIKERRLEQRRLMRWVAANRNDNVALVEGLRDGRWRDA